MTKILIVEDDKFIASAYRLKITKLGFEAQLASDGEEAMKILQTFTPDLVILDLIMPKMDGFATLEAIKKEPRFKDLPILIASNLGQKEDLDRGMKLGAVGYIIKTEMSMDDLAAKIKSILHL